MTKYEKFTAIQNTRVVTRRQCCEISEQITMMCVMCACADLS